MQNNRNSFFKFIRDNNLRLYNRKIKSSPFLDLDTFFPQHKDLEKNWKEIKKEIEGVILSGKKIPKFHEIDDGQEYISDKDGLDWSLLNLKVYNMWHPENKILCPITSRLISSMKNVSGACFSSLSPGKHIPPHKGPYKGIMRYQLGLSVPKSGECKLLVDNNPYFWTEGESVLFDDTYTHEVINNTGEKRIALLLDIKRPVSGLFQVYDWVVFRVIQILVVLNNTFKKSSLK